MAETGSADGAGTTSGSPATARNSERSAWPSPSEGTAAVGLVAFAFYVATVAPAPYLLDSAELAAASFGLGIAHPPGEPLALLLGRLFTLFPLGSVAFRVGLLQACAGAIAAALTHRLAGKLIAALDPAEVLGRWGRQALSATAGLGFALAPGALISANRPEVYALGAALALAAVCLAHAADTPALDGNRDQDAEADPRPLLLAAMLVGAGLGNHPLIAGLAGVGAVAFGVVVWLRCPGARLRLGLAAIAAFVVGALVLLYLPARGFALAAAGNADA
ncbi:MAG TPA: DUF2723 domain-containing protein, partial [Polyangia bacterium]